MLYGCVRENGVSKRLFCRCTVFFVLVGFVVFYHRLVSNHSIFRRWPLYDDRRIFVGTEGDDDGASGPGLSVSSRCRRPYETVHLGVVACGSRLTEPLLMLKSAIMMGSSPLHIHIFADDTLGSKFEQSLTVWLRFIVWRSVSYSIHEIWFPADSYAEWKHLFKLCSSERLFLPDLLPDVDALLYVDTDIIFLRQVEDIWDLFATFSSQQVAGLAPESEDEAVNWYKRFARHPYFEPLGLNSGLMLMNLTRMRQFNWGLFLTPLLQKYKNDITWGDQDIINIIFSQHPEKVSVLSCDLNFRPDHCMYQPSCLAATDEGVSVLHGNRGYFHLEKEPVFKAVYETFIKFRFGDDFMKTLIAPLELKLAHLNHTRCGQMYESFTVRLRRSYDNMKACRAF